MRDEELYALLKSDETPEKDWVKSAEQFLKLKIASGGVTQRQLELTLKKEKIASRLQEMSKEAVSEKKILKAYGEATRREAGIRNRLDDSGMAISAQRQHPEYVKARKRSRKLYDQMHKAYERDKGKPAPAPAPKAAPPAPAPTASAPKTAPTPAAPTSAPKVHAPSPSPANAAAKAAGKSKLLKRLGIAGGIAAGTGAAILGGRALYKHFKGKDEGKTKKAGLVPVSPEEEQDAARRGFLTGVRSHVSGDISRADSVRRKRGETLLKTLGAISGGTGGGLLGNRLSPGLGGTALGVGAGALSGHMLGKAVGSEIDRARMVHGLAPKEAELEKQTEKDSEFGKEGAAPKEPLNWVQQIRKHVAEAAAKKAKVGCMASKVASVRERLRAKLAQEDLTMPIQPEQTPPPSSMGGTGEMDPAALADFLETQQQVNEAEFFRQQAEEAGAQAAQLQEHAEMLQQQNQQLQQQTQQAQMESQQQSEMAQQQTQAAQQESQMAQQDAMSARNESLTAQQQSLQIRNAVTQYRQQLMDLLSQDPMAMMGPPAVPTGPAPMPPGQPPGPEQGGPPPEAASGPPGAEQGGPPPGAEGMPPEAAGDPSGGQMPPGAEMPPPEAPQPPAQQGGGNSPVTVNVKAPKAEKPKQPPAAA